MCQTSSLLSYSNKPAVHGTHCRDTLFTPRCSPRVVEFRNSGHFFVWCTVLELRGIKGPKFLHFCLFFPYKTPVWSLQPWGYTTECLELFHVVVECPKRCVWLVGLSCNVWWGNRGPPNLPKFLLAWNACCVRLSNQMQIIRDCLLCDRNGCRSTCASWTLTTCWMHRRYNVRATGRTRQLVCEQSNDVLLFICLYHIAKCRDDLVTLKGNLVLHCGVRCKCISLHVTNIQSYNLLLLVCMSWTVTGQPRNSVFIRRVWPR